MKQEKKCLTFFALEGTKLMIKIDNATFVGKKYCNLTCVRHKN